MKNVFTLLVCLCISMLSIAQTTKYVSPQGAGLKNGSSWANAADSSMLQQMINASGPNDNIWVAKGTYKPTASPPGATGAVDSRDFTFFMHNSVNLYGGFNVSDTSMSQRDTTGVSTILSGNINNTLPDSDNAYHVILFYRYSGRMDGFTITGGKANGSHIVQYSIDDAFNSTFGGGIYIHHATPTIQHCLIKSNTAYTNGGGIYITDSADATFSHCVILSNHVTYNAVGAGGAGVCQIFHSNSSFSQCSILSNVGTYSGGGMSNIASTMTVDRSVIAYNSASSAAGSGGALYNFGNAEVTFTSCVFENNYAGSRGGGIYCESSASGSCGHCTMHRDYISGLVASEIYNSGNWGLENSILWAGSQLTYNASVFTNNTYYCNLIQSFQSMTSPFVNESNPAGADNILGTTDDGLQLSCSSLNNHAIDSAVGACTFTTINYDILGNRFGVLSTPDRGAYETQDLHTPAIIDSISSAGDTICASDIWMVHVSYHNGANATVRYYVNNISYASGNIPGSALHNGDSIYAVVTIAEPCNHASARSAARKVTLLPIVNPGVNLPNSFPDFCAGQTATFTCTYTNGGSNPVFRWYNDNALLSNTGSNPTYTWHNMPYSGNLSSLKLRVSITTGSNPCGTSTIAWDSVYVTVYPKDPAPTITIDSSQQNGAYSIEVVNHTTQYYYFRDGVQVSHYWYFYTPDRCGTYYAITNDAHCNSDTSNRIHFNTARPNITESNHVLTSDAVNHQPTHQWYYNGTEISGATNATYTATQNGDYYDIVTINGCASPPSNTITISDFSTGIINVHTPSENISVYPNPASETLYIKTQSADIEAIRIFDINGFRIFESNNPLTDHIDISSWAAGSYVAEVHTKYAITHIKWTKL